MRLACVRGVAAARGIAHEDAGLLAAIVIGLAAADIRGFAVGLTRPDVGRRYAGGAPIFTQPADGGIPAGSDLPFLVRANGAPAPVTHTSTPAPKEGDTMILPGPAPAVS